MSEPTISVDQVAQRACTIQGLLDLALDALPPARCPCEVGVKDDLRLARAECARLADMLNQARRDWKEASRVKAGR